MVEHPILFNSEMVRAILEGRKTVTRRAIKPRFPASVHEVLPYRQAPCAWMPRDPQSPDDAWDEQVRTCPFGKPGDRLWVREAFRDARTAGVGRVLYKASGDVACSWKPSIHMPRECSRILLDVAAVRVERLQDIGEEQAVAEGAEPYDVSALTADELELIDAPLKEQDNPNRNGFAMLWESTGGSWEANPWVWVVEFKRAEVASA